MQSNFKTKNNSVHSDNSVNIEVLQAMNKRILKSTNRRRKGLLLTKLPSILETPQKLKKDNMESKNKKPRKANVSKQTSKVLKQTEGSYKNSLEKKESKNVVQKVSFSWYFY